MEILRERPHMFGISGVMPKMATHLAERGTIVSSAKIVKFDSPDYIGASLVEFACLLACERVGLTVPAIQIAPDASSLSIDRFDMIDGNRIAFEDACALSGLKRTGKYSGSVEHLFDMLDNFLDPGELPDARADLVKLLIMCDVLRNGDAHMKNFGLLYMEDLSRPWLAPVYDVLTTPVWIPKDTPALRTFKDVPAGGEWLDQQSIHQLEEFSQLNGFDAVAFREQCVEVAISTMKEIVPEAPRGRRHDALGRALRIVEAGAELRPPLPPPSVRRRGARTPRAA
jgi:serine/threonine-protein kinase HipA